MAAKYDSSFSSQDTKKDITASKFDEFNSDLERTVVEPLLYNTAAGDEQKLPTADNDPSTGKQKPDVMFPAGGYQPGINWKKQINGPYSDDLARKQPNPTGMKAWAGFGCCLFALTCMCLSFSSPYWLQTWSFSQNNFKNIGLWEVCFDDYMHFKDDSQQVYSECWWMFSKEPKYYKLREWLTPPWFITCQVLVTGCLIVEITTVITTALIFLHCCPLLHHEYLQTYAMIASASMMFFVTMVSFVVAVLFGVQMNDRFWLPRPDQNFLSWGFGFLVISSIFALFSGALLFKAGTETYNILLAKEDEYLKSALEIYSDGDQLDYGNSTYPLVVLPGSSSMRPPSYSTHDIMSDQKQPPLSAASQVPSDDVGKPGPSTASDSWSGKPQLPSDTFDRDMSTINTLATRTLPDYATYEPAGESSRLSDIPVPVGAYEQQRQPNTFYQGKSYEKSYERRLSEVSYGDEDQEEFFPKIERQY